MCIFLSKSTDFAGLRIIIHKALKYVLLFGNEPFSRQCPISTPSENVRKPFRFRKD